MNTYYVYLIIDPRTDLPFYIGKGSKDRYLWHEKTVTAGKETGNYYKDNKIRKILASNLKIEYHLIENLREQEAYDLESQLIAVYGRVKYDTDGILTNVCKDNRPPDSSGRVHTEETKQKISVALKGTGKTSNFGEKNGFFKKKHTEENLKKLSDNARKQWTGVKRTEENKKNLSKSYTEERTQKARERRIAYNKNLPEHHRQAMARSAAKRRYETKTKKVLNDFAEFKKVIDLLNSGLEVKVVQKQSKFTYNHIWSINKDLAEYNAVLSEIKEKKID